MMRERTIRSTVIFAAGACVLTLAPPVTAQSEPLGVRRSFMGMHNLKDGGPAILTGFHWTKNLTGDTGYVFDWVFDYAPNSPLNWVAEAIKLDLVPCVRAQECNGGCTPNAGYPGQVASQILDWKLANPQYADRLVYIQMWNEPGDPRDFVPMTTFADYMVAAHANVHNAVASAALSNPDVAGTILTMTPGQNNPGDWEIALQHNSSAANAFDVWGTHPYPESYPPHYNMHEGHGFVTKHKMIDGYLRDLDKFAEYGRRGVRVMITETAYGDHLGISYEGYPKTTRQMAADYNVEAFGTWWYQWPEIIAVHPYILSNVSWNAFAWANGSSVDTDGDGINEPTAPFPQYTAVRQWRIDKVAAGELAPARLVAYRGNVGKITGVVTRADTGEPVRHANVYTDGYEFGGPSLYDGQFDIHNVPVGTYTLTVEKRGYAPKSTQVTVTNNSTSTANFSMTYTGKVPKGFYFVDCGAPGLICQGGCSGCSLYATFHGQTFKTPPDIGFIKYAAVKPNVGDVTLKFTVIQGNNPNGTVIGSFNSYYLESQLGGEMIGGEAPGDGIPVSPNTEYFLKVERTDGQGIYLFTSNTNPYPDGIRWVGNTPQSGWDLYAAIRGNTVAVSTDVGTLAGTVKDTSNNPISGATVTTNPGSFSATTNGSGSYTISNVPVATYNVTAQAANFSPSTATGKTVSTSQTTTVNFNLAAGPTTGTITGTVTNVSGGSPISGATVQTTTGSYSTTTNGSGVYTLSNVAPGSYTVQVSKSGFDTEQSTGVSVIAGLTTTRNIQIAAVAAFSGLSNGNFEGGFYNNPDADHKSGNSWTQFTASGFSKSGGFYSASNHSPNWAQSFWESNYISGIYQRATGADVGNCYHGSVWVKASSSSAKFWVGLDPTGGTNPNSAHIVWSAATQPGGTWTQISTQAAATSSAITLYIKAENPTAGNVNAYIDDAAIADNGATQTGTISGNVKDNSSNNLEGATVTANPGGFTGTTDSSGNYTISNVLVGTYSVTADAPAFDPSTSTGVSVTNGNTTTANFTLTPTPAPQIGDIEGTVKTTGGSAISGATVVISESSASATTAGNGTFGFTNVASGTYTLTASKSGYFDSTEVTVQVSDNETTTVDFVLTAVPAGSVTEDFETMPSWSSTYNAGWGSAASFSIVSGGQNQLALDAQRSSGGSSVRVKTYTISSSTAYTISVYMKGSSSSNTYWAETAYRLGSHSASDFDNNPGNWTMIKKFSNSGTNGNSNTWTKYSATFNSGGNTQISVGFKLGSSGGSAPVIAWDTLRVE